MLRANWVHLLKDGVNGSALRLLSHRCLTVGGWQDGKDGLNAS